MIKKRMSKDPFKGVPTTDIPVYSIKEAARYLQIPDATLRYWVVGKRYRTSGGTTKAMPLVKLAGLAKKKGLLAFSNLVEAHVLCAIRRAHQIPLPKVRKALDFVERAKGFDRPLIDEEFETDGADLFIEQLGTLINATGAGQTEMREVLAAHLNRIERDEQGLLLRLFPFTRDQVSADQPKHVVINPKIAFGRPVIAGTGIPTSIVWRRFKAGESVNELVRDYKCTLEQIEEALRCAPAEAA